MRRRLRERCVLYSFTHGVAFPSYEKEEGEECCREIERWGGADILFLQVKIQAIKDKRVKKEEKARFEKLAETMHRKRVERLKRKEKRNKMLKS